jgi:hypothetical protein
MTDDLLSLRVLFVSPAPADQELFRRAASASRIPIEVIEADGVASASRSFAVGVDIAFLDGWLGDDAIEKVTAAARAAAKPPFTVLMSGQSTKLPFSTDALAIKPSGM